jgi:hypothetical protein
MDCNTNAAVPASPRSRITERELAAAKVKLLGLTLLAVVDLLVIACTKWPL